MDPSVLQSLAALAARRGNAKYQAKPEALADLAAPSEKAAVAPSAPDIFSASLFPGVKPREGGLPPDLIAALLPPPPPGAPRSAFYAWFYGKIHDPLAPVLAFDPALGAGLEDLMALEVEWLADGATSIARAGGRRPADPLASEADAGWLDVLSGPIIAPEVEFPAARAAVQGLAAAIAEILSRYEPKAAEALASVAAELRVDARLARILAKAVAIEAEWLVNGPSGGTAAQIPLGAPSANSDLRTPVVLRRTAYLHLFAAKSVTTCLRDALVELRFAQFLAWAPETLTTPGEIEERLSNWNADNKSLEAIANDLVRSYLEGAARGSRSPAHALDPGELFDRFRARAQLLEVKLGMCKALAEREALREVALSLGLPPSDLIRVWTLVPRLYPALREVTFRLSPSGSRG